MPETQALNQRLHDLVRQMRVELFKADLITDEEYAELSRDHAAVARLESYDEVRERIEGLERQLAEAKAEISRQGDWASGYAPATDLANSWARELSIEQAKDERGLHALVGRLWDEVTGRYARLIRTEAVKQLSQELAESRERSKQLQTQLEAATEPYYDSGSEGEDEGVTWRVPTAFDYRCVCKSNDAWKEQAERLAAALDKLHRKGQIGLIMKPMYVKILAARDSRVRAETLRAAAGHASREANDRSELGDRLSPSWWKSFSVWLECLAANAERGEWPEVPNGND